MTINAENPSKMVLQDNKQTAYLSACACVGIGLLIACAFARHNAVPVIVGLAFIGVGALILFKTKRVTIDLDKSSATIHILLQGLKSKTERNLGFGQIQKLLLRRVIQTHTMSQNQRIGGDVRRTSSTTTYHQFILVFVTDQNEQIPFNFARVKVGLMNMLSSPEEKIGRNAREVANFLNVPLEEAGPASASDALGALRAGLAGRLQKVN